MSAFCHSDNLANYRKVYSKYQRCSREKIHHPRDPLRHVSRLFQIDPSIRRRHLRSCVDPGSVLCYWAIPRQGRSPSAAPDILLKRDHRRQALEKYPLSPDLIPTQLEAHIFVTTFLPLRSGCQLEQSSLAPVLQFRSALQLY